MTFTGEYFLAEYHRFRNVMCSRKYDSNQKLLGFKGLFGVFLHVPKEDELFDICKAAFDALFEELPRRLAYETIEPLTKLLMNNHAGEVYAPDRR